MAKPGKNTKADTEEVANLKAQLVRALADYDNLRKRVDKERETFGTLASLSVVSRMVPILDILEDAQNHLKDSGLAIALGEFEKALKEEGFERISAQRGDDFTADLHEAIDTGDDPELSEGKVISQILGGWKYKDGPVIRHAKVKVVKKPVVDSK